MMEDVPLNVDTIKSEQVREVYMSSEDKLRNLLEKTSECILFLDNDGRILDINNEILDVFGYSKGEMIGKQFTELDVLSSRDIPKVMDEFSKILGGKEVIFDLTIKNKQGHWMVLKCSGSIIRTDGKFDGIMVIVRDITERDQMQKILHHSEERYRHLVESIKDVIYSVDKYGNITSVNRAVKTLLGVKSDELIGRNILEFIPKEELSKAKAYMRRVNSGEDLTTDISIIDKSGRRHEVEFSSTSIIKDDKVVGSLGIVRDVTEQRQVEKDLTSSKERWRILFEYAPDAFF